MKLNFKQNPKKGEILHVKFSFKNISAMKCTSYSTYIKDAEIFASQFKKEKDPVITMEIIKILNGKEFTK